MHSRAGVISLDLLTRASQQGWLPQGSSCLHSEGTASTQGKPQSLYNLISGSFPWLLLDLWVVFTGFGCQAAHAPEGVCLEGSPRSCYPTRATSVDQQLSWHTSAGRRSWDILHPETDRTPSHSPSGRKAGPSRGL